MEKSSEGSELTLTECPGETARRGEGKCWARIAEAGEVRALEETGVKVAVELEDDETIVE